MKNFALMVIGLAVLIGLMMPADPGAQTAETSGETLVVGAPAEAGGATIPAAPVTTAYSSGGAVAFEPGANGHFHTEASIGGTKVRFLVDTGASVVALTEADAWRVGIPFSTSDFVPVGRQVSGELRGKPVMLGEVRVGSKVVRDVEAVIVEGATMNLLGQSFLRRAGRIEMDGETMVLR